MREYAFLFPGQGSQGVGMGKALCERYAVARDRFAEADEALGFSLSRVCFEGPAEELALTATTQPAILTCSVAAWAVVREALGIVPKVCLGHSLGEFSALVSVGALSFADAVRLVRLRGEAMQEAVPAGVGAMAAVIGLDGEELERLCGEASRGEVVTPANENGGGQVVVAGHAGAVARVSELAKQHKAKAIPLKVSAPFHCSLMEPAAKRLQTALQTVTVHPMSAPVISNVDAASNADPSRVKDLLVRQVTSKVRWEASVNAVTAMGIRAGLELGHAKVLAGLVRRIAPDLAIIAVGSPEDIDVLKDVT